MSYRRSTGLVSAPVLGLVVTCLILLMASVVPALGLKRIMILPPQSASSSSMLDTNGGVLPTDPDLETKLRRADEYVGQGRYDLASVIWQNVLDMSSTALRSADGRLFTSVQYHVEQQLYLLARDKPGAIAAYRVKADGEALGLIAGAKGADQEKKLSEVVRRFFFSNHGDQAAYTLGCLMLDRFEFIAAGRLFGKLIDQHPDYMPNATGRRFAPRGEVLLRLAIAHARSGDSKAALASLGRLENEAAVDVTPGVIAMVRDDIANSDNDGRDPALAVQEGNWPMAHGTPSRDAFMAGLPEETEYKGVWGAQWVAQFPSVETDNRPLEDRLRARERMRFKWVGRDDAAGDWAPSGRMLLHDGRVYFKGYKQLVCVDAKSGKLQWLSNVSEPYVQPLNGTLKEELFSFGDRTRTEISADRDVVYFFEDDTSQTIKSSTSQQFRGNLTPMMMAYPDRYGNKLVAIDAQSGKLLWQFASDKDADGNTKALRFTAAPVPAGGMLFVPAFDGTSHWMYAIKSDRNEQANRVIWKTLLCDEPQGGVSPWETVGVSVDGGDVYVCNGTGWVFNLDAASGHVRWAVPYTRQVSYSNSRYRNRAAATPLGFDVNTVIPVGRHLVVLATDAAELSGDVDPMDNIAMFSLDRRTGKKLWHVEREGAKHFLGVYDDALYVAGSDFVAAYSITKKQGAQLGTTLSTDSITGRITGRGFVSPDGVYLPTYDASASVLRLDLKTLKPLSRVGVRLPIKDAQGDVAYFDPLGNLFSDGQRLFGVGLERAYALRHGTTKLVARPNPIVSRIDDKDDGKETLTGANDSQTLRLHGIEENVESLTKYFLTLHPSDADRKRFASLIKQLGDVAFDVREKAERSLRTLPVVPVEMLKKAVEEAADLETVNRARRIIARTSGQRERVLNAVFRIIAEKKIKGLGKQTLAAAPLCTEPYLLVSARKALVATVRLDDAPALRKALKDPSADTRIIAAAAIGTLLEIKAVDDLNALFKDKHSKVRLAAARALADMGDRGSLEKFLALMEDEDVYIRSDASSSLRALTGQRFAFIAYEKKESRAEALGKWTQWVAANGKTAKLQFPLSSSRFLLGRTLIANYSASRLYEIDSRTGKETWSTTVSRPWVCYGTPQGHRLVTAYSAKTVYEYNAQGKLIWQVPNLPTYPQGIQRLENGNTLVACSSSNRLVEIRPDKKFAWERTIASRPTNAFRLPGGNTLVTLQSSGKVVEIDRDGKVQWEINGLKSPIAAQRLENGNTLICEVSGRRVLEYSRDKKIVWDSAKQNVVLQSPICAQRLENGNTLISDYKGIYEVTPEGKIVWKRLEVGIRGFHRY